MREGGEVISRVAVTVDGYSKYYAGQGTEMDVDDFVDELADSLSKITK